MYQGSLRPVKATDEQIKLVWEIWDNRQRLGLDVNQEVIKQLTTNEQGEYLPAVELRRLNHRYKNERRGKATVAVSDAKEDGGGGGGGTSCGAL
jgi:hypothetical protein